jgi:hypothetical protein
METFYTVSEYGLAAFLIYIGYQSQGYENDPATGKIKMCFERSKEVVDAARLYRNAESDVEPKAYSEVLRKVAKDFTEKKYGPRRQ